MEPKDKLNLLCQLVGKDELERQGMTWDDIKEIESEIGKALDTLDAYSLLFTPDEIFEYKNRPGSLAFRFAGTDFEGDIYEKDNKKVYDKLKLIKEWSERK